MRWIFILATASSLLAENAPPPMSPRDVMRAAMEKQQAAAAQQRGSIRKQAENLGVWLPPSSEKPADPAPIQVAGDADCDPIADAAIAPIVEAAAKSQSLDPKLIRAVIEQESAWRPCAISAKGAKGLMQLMPQTAQDLGVRDAFDPRENVEGGTKYLKQLLEKYAGDLAQALGAYNSGPGTVDQAGGVPNIRETRDYVKAVMDRMRAPPKP